MLRFHVVKSLHSKRPGFAFAFNIAHHNNPHPCPFSLRERVFCLPTLDQDSHIAPGSHSEEMGIITYT